MICDIYAKQHDAKQRLVSNGPNWPFGWPVGWPPGPLLSFLQAAHKLSPKTLPAQRRGPT
eukprot:7890922-Pyramimonas_sp.AAC.1